MGKVYPASKIIVNNEVMLDVTNTTATTKEIAKGFRIVSATGAEIEGTLHTQIFVAKIFNGTIEVIPEGFSPDWFSSANEAKEAYLMNEDLELRDGDFLILETYFSYYATDVDITLTGLPQRETYVYQEEQHHWLTIGASTLCDNTTIELINGQVSLKNALQLDIDADAEYIPYL